MSKIVVGSIVRHLKRGTRYRIMGSFHALMRCSMDGSSRILILSVRDIENGLAPQMILPDQVAELDAGDSLCMSVPVMVQASEDHPDGPVEVLLYASLDEPARFFVRAAEEFDGRFEEISIERNDA